MYEPLSDDYIEIEPKVFGMNSRDVLTTLGHIEGNHLGYECSGIVTRLGKGVNDSHFKVGDRVCAVMQGHFGTPVRLPGRGQVTPRRGELRRGGIDPNGLHNSLSITVC